MRKPTIPEVLPLVVALYERCGAGCCLHVIIDDGNDEQVFADHCARDACDECKPLADLVVRMSDRQRRKLYNAHVQDF